LPLNLIFNPVLSFNSPNLFFCQKRKKKKTMSTFVQCKGIIASGPNVGKQCSNKTDNPSGYCGSHLSQDPAIKAITPTKSAKSGSFPQCAGMRHQGKNAGTRCDKEGKYNGYCHRHVSQDKSREQNAPLPSESDGDTLNNQLLQNQIVEAGVLLQKIKEMTKDKEIHNEIDAYFTNYPPQASEDDDVINDVSFSSAQVKTVSTTPSRSQVQIVLDEDSAAADDGKQTKIVLHNPKENAKVTVTNVDDETKKGKKNNKK
jgi:hypothetical protein